MDRIVQEFPIMHGSRRQIEEERHTVLPPNAIAFHSMWWVGGLGIQTVVMEAQKRRADPWSRERPLSGLNALVRAPFHVVLHSWAVTNGVHENRNDKSIFALGDG
jgi:hypothetical protein